jgi:hypothetical protein
VLELLVKAIRSPDVTRLKRSRVLPVAVFGQPCVKRAAKVAEVGAENVKRTVVWREPLERMVAGAHELE